MNVLITGANGFIGSNFLKLINNEHHFSNDTIILLSSKEIPGYKCVLHKDYAFTKNDIVRAGIDRIDMVFHLGSAVPRKNEEFSLEYAYKYVMNVRNTIHLFENLPNIPEKFIFISSVSIYKNDGLEISESSDIQTNEMYGTSKLMCEKYLEEQARRNNFTLQILRLGQIYGPGEEIYAKIVSGFMNQVMNNQQINIFSDGSDVRSILFVEDCCRYILEAASFSEYIGPVNIASSQSITVKELVNLIYETFGNAIEKKVCYGNIKDKGISKNIYNTTKIINYFTGKEISLRDGIGKYYDYYINKQVVR